MNPDEKSCETCEHAAEHDHGHVEPRELVRIGLVAVAAAGAWLRCWPLAGAVDVVAVAAVVIGGWPISWDRVYSAFPSMTWISRESTSRS